MALNHLQNVRNLLAAGDDHWFSLPLMLAELPLITEQIPSPERRSGS